MAHWAPTHIFHPTDFTDDDVDSFAHALRLVVGTRGRLSLLHCGQSDDSVHWEYFPHVSQTLAKWGMVEEEKGSKALHSLGISCNKVQLNHNSAVDAILHYIEEHGPDLAVMKTHQRSGVGYLLDPSNSFPIARRSGVPTLFVPTHIDGFVCPQSGDISLERILVPIQPGLHTQRSVLDAVAIATALGRERVSLRLLASEGDVEEHPVTAPSEPGWETSRVTVRGNVLDAIPDYVAEHDIDLVALRTTGVCGLFDALLGTPIERLISHVDCPVLAIPSHRAV